MKPSVVLCYHAVSSSWPSPLAITPARFREQVEYLLGRGCRPLRFRELVEESGRNGGSNGRGGAFAVTFDDGFRSVFDTAFPILAELGVPATLFVPTALVGAEGPMSWPGVEQWLGTPHQHELEGVGWDELRELHGHGWEIGSHGRAHPRLTDLDDATLREDLAESKRACEREIDAECASLAFPYGDEDARVRAAADAVGYRAAATMRPGRPEPLRWPRIGVYPVDGPVRFRLKASPAVGEIRATSIGKLIERARVSVPAAELAMMEEALGLVTL